MEKIFRLQRMTILICRCGWLHQCCRRNMLVATKEVLVTVLAVFVPDILYLVSISVGHQHSKGVTNNEILSPTPKNCHQHPLVTNIYVACVIGP